MSDVLDHAAHRKRPTRSRQEFIYWGGSLPGIRFSRSSAQNSVSPNLDLPCRAPERTLTSSTKLRQTLLLTRPQV